MGHDVFVSYAHEDKPVADAAVARLEAQGIRCWIAPRDIRPGADWGGEIVDAIAASRVVVLLFSAHANASPHIKREVERAVHKGLIIIPVRIEDVEPSATLEYYVSTPHWLDAITPPFDAHVSRLAEFIHTILRDDRTRGAPPPHRLDETAATPIPPRTGPASSRPRSARVAATALATLAVVLGVVAWHRFGGSPKDAFVARLESRCDLFKMPSGSPDDVVSKFDDLVRDIGALTPPPELTDGAVDWTRRLRSAAQSVRDAGSRLRAEKSGLTDATAARDRVVAKQAECTDLLERAKLAHNTLANEAQPARAVTDERTRGPSDITALITQARECQERQKPLTQAMKDTSGRLDPLRTAFRDAAVKERAQLEDAARAAQALGLDHCATALRRVPWSPADQ